VPIRHSGLRAASTTASTRFTSSVKPMPCMVRCSPIGSRAGGSLSTGVVGGEPVQASRRAYNAGSPCRIRGTPDWLGQRGMRRAAGRGLDQLGGGCELGQQLHGVLQRQLRHDRWVVEGALYVEEMDGRFQ
jgi:hypothetical protein